MAGTVTITNTFAAQSGPIPLSQLDANFSVLATGVNSVNNFGNYYVDASGAANTVTVTVSGGQTVSYAAGLYDGLAFVTRL